MSSVRAPRVQVGWTFLSSVVFFALLPACDDPGLTGKWHGELTVTPGGVLSLSLNDDSGSIFGSGIYRDSQGEFETSVDGNAEDGRIVLGFSSLDGGAHYE